MSAQEHYYSSPAEQLEDDAFLEAQQPMRPSVKPQKSAMQSYRMGNFSYEPPPSPTSRVSDYNIAHLAEQNLT